MEISVTFSVNGGFDLDLGWLQVAAIGSSDFPAYPFGWFEVYLIQDIRKIKLLSLGKIKLPESYYIS